MLAVLGAKVEVKAGAELVAMLGARLAGRQRMLLHPCNESHH